MFSRYAYPLFRVTIIDASTGHEVNTLPADNVFEIGFSPCGTYVSTWQRATKDECGDAVKNLKVWNVVEKRPEVEGEERGPVGCFVQKSISGWNLQYTPDEMYCARAVTNEIHFYESGDLGRVWNRLRVEGITDFACSPGSDRAVAVFVPERKGQPAAVKVFKVPEFEKPVSQKTFFKGDKVQLKWNSEGTALIVLAQTEVDKSGKSYYGETTLYLLSADGQFDARIALGKSSNRLFIPTLTCMQTKMAPFMTLPGHRIRRSSESFMAICRPRPLCSIFGQIQRTTSL